MDIETFKGLLIINGGGAVALLSFLAAILNKLGDTNTALIHAALIHAVLWGVLLMMVGLGAAVAHNYLRRRCSLALDAQEKAPPSSGFALSGQRLGGNPTVCFVCWGFMWVSLGAFMTAGVVVAIVGLRTL
jgi:hypothetical protein